MKKILSIILVALVILMVPVTTLASTTDYTTGKTKPSGRIYHSGVRFEKIFDNRVTITCGNVLYPGVEPGNYTDAQIAKIESTWVTFTIYPRGMMPVVFAGGLEINNKTYNEGVAAYVGSTTITIKVRNGEIVLWNNLEDMHADIQLRMAPQIEEGNLDIDYELDFKACSSEIKGYFPADLIKANGVETIDP